MHDIKVYSLALDGKTALSRHFKAREFRSRDGADPIFVSPRLVELVENIRCHFGRPLVITSGYRTPRHNAAIGGAAHSQHLYGRAADIVVWGVSPERVADYAETLMPRSGGVGRYRGFTHVDVRDTKARWRG